MLLKPSFGIKKSIPENPETVVVLEPLIFGKSEIKTNIENVVSEDRILEKNLNLKRSRKVQSANNFFAKFTLGCLGFVVLCGSIIAASYAMSRYGYRDNSLKNGTNESRPFLNVGVSGLKLKVATELQSRFKEIDEQTTELNKIHKYSRKEKRKKTRKHSISNKIYSEKEIQEYIECETGLSLENDTTKCQIVLGQKLPEDLARQYHLKVFAKKLVEKAVYVIPTYSVEDVENYLECEKFVDFKESLKVELNCSEILDAPGIRGAILDYVFSKPENTSEKTNGMFDREKAAIPINCILDELNRSKNNDTVSQDLLLLQHRKALCFSVLEEWRVSQAKKKEVLSMSNRD